MNVESNIKTEKCDSNLVRVARRFRAELKSRGRNNDSSMDEMCNLPGAPVASTHNEGWSLVVESGGRPFQVRLPRTSVNIGRDRSCEIRVPSDTVSRFHCCLRVRGDMVYVEDLGSRNGTFHNGRRIIETALECGDRLRVGPVTFRLYASNHEAVTNDSAETSITADTITDLPRLT